MTDTGRPPHAIGVWWPSIALVLGILAIVVGGILFSH
jgi:hypothetical protein